jgi:hypothetical protein
MNRRGGPPIYLNVELDPMRKRSAITHEAAVRTGAAYEPFYMLFARAEDGEVRSLTAVGADAIVRADRRRPADPAEKGPDLLMDAKTPAIWLSVSGPDGRASRRSEAEEAVLSEGSGTGS